MVTWANDPEYADRYVAFLDILGFSDLTRRAHEHPEWRDFLRSSISTLKKTLPVDDGQGFRFVQFSDSIVLSAAKNRDGLRTITRGCIMLVRNMLSRGILLRGGIAGGNLHHDAHMMFGPGLLDAYEFEKRGGPPHIALHEEVVHAFGPSLFDPPAMEYVCQDPWDLQPMLHTLIEFETYDGIPRVGGEVLDGEASLLAALIRAMAWDMTAKPDVRAKWRWLQDYWNRSVRKAGILSVSEEAPDMSETAQTKIRQRRNTLPEI